MSDSAENKLPLHLTLSYYKREDIRVAMAAQARAKEIAVRYGEGFGKRPDIIIYDSDILRFAQKKATSFHVSEEMWSNPMQLTAGMRKSEMDELRIGWDLIIDIDFPVWDATTQITDALIAQLQKEGVPPEAITVKFSGNKGFHIAVPFEAFPDTVTDSSGAELLTSDVFPDGARLVVEYLAHKIDGPENNYALSEKLATSIGLAKLQDLLITVETSTGKQVAGKVVEGYDYECEVCRAHTRSEDSFVQCPTPTCKNRLMKRISDSPVRAAATRRKVNLEIDTMLVSSRHMYRMVYSLHEKSGLASIPIDKSDVLSFDRETAEPANVTTSIPFLSRDVPRGCATRLIHEALKFQPPGQDKPKTFEEVTWDGEAAPEEVFPPTIKKMLGPLRDGRKRALFVLTNFLRSVGWSYDMIEARLHEWNDSQEDPLREGNLKGHIRYHKQKNQNVLPPNFDNDMYYKDLGVLEHDELSQRLKNPVQYVRMKLKQRGGSEGLSKENTSD